MTLNELHKKIKKLIKNNQGKKEVYVMQVESGITLRQKVLEIDPAEKYDGDFIWIYPEDIELPEWMRM